MSKNVVSTKSAEPPNLLVRLEELQKKYGCIPEKAIVELSASLGVPVNRIYGVASFYSFLSVKPLGRNVIRVCKSLPCYLKNSRLIVDSVQREIGIKPGETTADGRFSFQLTNCIGLCDKAPAMLINNDAHVDLTPGKIAQILSKYK